MATQLNRYRVHRLIARGGMADVLLASPCDAISRAEFVAIKRIRPELADDPSFVRMFLDEARITRQLNHPNITALLDWGDHQGVPYLVMEFIAGIDLGPLLRRGPLPVHLAAEVGAAVGRALHHAHEQRNEAGECLGIVHRDVTPHNVMLTFDGWVKLLDFGIALARVRAERTRTGILKGKWSYMSPEQVAGQEVDQRSDVFSLGTLIYEMLTGERAFKESSPAETLAAVALRDPPPPDLLVPDLPARLIELVRRCMSKQPRRRPQTAAEVSDALEAIHRELLASGKQETLAEYLLRHFPDRQVQVQTVLNDLESSFGSAAAPLDSLDGQTVIQPVPFLRSAADLDDSQPSAEVVSPLPAEEKPPALDLHRPTPVTPTPARLPTEVDAPFPPPIPWTPAQADAPADDDLEPRRSTWLIVLAVFIGLTLGVGLVFAAWYLRFSS